MKCVIPDCNRDVPRDYHGGHLDDVCKPCQELIEQRKRRVASRRTNAARTYNRRDREDVYVREVHKLPRLR